MKYDIIIIGGGASGLMAAITAARNNKSVLILERNDKPAKKLLATGNGRCNYTNELMDSAMFRGENPSFILSALRAFNEIDAINFFRDIGIEPKSKNGYLYPRNMEAKSVCSALIAAANIAGVNIKTSMLVTQIKRDEHRFICKTSDDSFAANRIIICCGGKSAPSTGSDGAILPILKKLGVRLISTFPALVPLIAKDAFLVGLSGVRCDCKATFIVDNKIKYVSQGELQITDYGLSGIVIFDGSRYISFGLHNLSNCSVEIDFLPEYSFDETLEIVHQRFKSNAFSTCHGALCGLFNSKLTSAMLFAAGIDVKASPHKINDNAILLLTRIIKSKLFEITGTKDFDRSQITGGGVDTSFVDPDTMEHKQIPGLYFSGEVLDVDAICGGYNLQWAWSSGYLAGMNASKSR